MDSEFKGLKTTGKSVVDEVPWGMYVWRLPSGEVLGDGDGNFMNVFCMKGNQKAQEAVKQAARHYGFPEGSVEWWPGKRRINDEELEEQQTRERLGLTADPLDYGAIKDEMRARKYNGSQ